MEKSSTKINIIRIWAYLGGIFIIVLVACFIWLPKIFNGMCGNFELSSTIIPGTGYKVVVFTRDCGATTNYSTEVSIIKTDENLKNESGNIFSAEDNHSAAPAGPGGGPEVFAKVISPNTIKLLHHPKARVIKAAESCRGIKISYSQMSTANQRVVR